MTSGCSSSSISHKGQVCWITGLSAAGKTSVAIGVTSRLRDAGKFVVHLDGDQLRELFPHFKGFERHERLSLGYQYSALAKFLSDQGAIVVVSAIALFSEIHLWNRTNIENYLEVFLDVPMDELIRRDPKGLYRRYLSGEIASVAGMDLKVDYPIMPDLVLTHDVPRTLEENIQSVINLFKKQVKDW